MRYAAGDLEGPAAVSHLRKEERSGDAFPNSSVLPQSPARSSAPPSPGSRACGQAVSYLGAAGELGEQAYLVITELPRLLREDLNDPNGLPSRFEGNREIGCEPVCGHPG